MSDKILSNLWRAQLVRWSWWLEPETAQHDGGCLWMWVLSDVAPHRQGAPPVKVPRLESTDAFAKSNKKAPESGAQTNQSRCINNMALSKQL